MKRYDAPHKAHDENKISKMVEVLENGQSLPPVVVNGSVAFTGSHRLEAYKRAGIEPNVVEISDDDYLSALAEMGLLPEDDVHDFGSFCAALYNITNDGDVKNAVEDQRE